MKRCSEAATSVPKVSQKWMMIVLTAVYGSNFVDRTIVNVLQQPIKEELGLADWQLGLLGGTSFAVFYALFGIYIARLAESRDRVKLMTLCIVAWSTFTGLCGVVTSFAQLLLLRVGVAVGEAGATPTSHSLISDYFSPEKRAGAIATFSLGSTLGIVFGALIGGLVGERWGWRWAFVVAAGPGLILALLMLFTVHEPRRSLAKHEDVPNLREVVRVLISKPAFRCLAGAAAMSAFSTYSILSFSTSHFMRSYEMPLRDAGLIAGVGGGIAMGLGALAGGFLAQRLARTDRRWMLFSPALGALCCVPLCLVSFLTDSVRVASLGFLALSFFMTTNQGPLFAVTHSFVGPRMRATSSAIVLLVMTLVGLGLGPLGVGMISDLLSQSRFSQAAAASSCQPGSLALDCKAATAAGLGLALSACALIFLASAALYAGAARTLAEDAID